MRLACLVGLALLSGCVTAEERQQIKDQAKLEVKAEVYAEAKPVIKDTALEVLPLKLPDTDAADLIGERSAAKLVQQAVDKLPDKVDDKSDEVEKEKKCNTLGNVLAAGSQLLLLLLSGVAKP